MKKSIIYLAISATLTFSGCDYLDDMPYDWAQPDDIFTNEQNYLKPINQVYAYIPEGFNHVGNAFLDAATNDGISTIIDSDIHKLSRGYITSSNPIEECWNKSYKGNSTSHFWPASICVRLTWCYKIRQKKTSRHLKIPIVRKLNVYKPYLSLTC